MDSAHRVGAAFEALLLEALLKPMASGAGEFGDVGLAAVAQHVAEADAHGFGALVALRLNDHAR